MRILLDTHTLIWCLENNPTLSDAARSAVVDGHNTVYVSAVSVWEMTIKKALGKLKIPDNLEEELKLHRFEPLSISIPHSLAVGTLPSIHTDPFDRLLIAQAMIEKLVFITRDQYSLQYPIQTVKA